MPKTDPLCQPLHKIDAAKKPLDFLLGRDAANLSRIIDELCSLAPALLRHLKDGGPAASNIRGQLLDLDYETHKLVRAALQGARR